MTDYATLKDGVLALCDDKHNSSCHWKLEDEYDILFYVTSCGYTFQFMGYGTKEADFNYCPYCGAAIDAQ